MGVGEKSRFDTSEWIEYERTHTGNLWGRGIKDAEERQIAYRSYCDHIMQGRFKYSWTYENPATNSHWTYETVERWIRETDEFPVDQLKVAEAKGFSTYEKLLVDSASGKNTRANVASLQMLMRNKYGWDKADKREVNAPEILASYERVMLLLADKQRPALEEQPKPLVTIDIRSEKGTDSDS